MSTAPIFLSFRFQPADINGLPLEGATLYFFTAGTTTPITVYQDAALSTPWGSSVVADGSGVFAPIYLASQFVKTALYDVNNILVQTIDNITVGNGDGTIILKQSTNPAPTAEGDIQWDTDNDWLVVGTGGSNVIIKPTSGGSSAFSDLAFRIQDNADATKQMAFEASGITTGTTRTYAAPDASGVLDLQGAGITTVASATSTAIGASATRDVIISGTTPITSFDTIAAGTIRNITFSGILTLTHNATSLILPGAANIATAVGDNCVAESLGSGNWRVISYQKADGTPVVAPSSGGGETLLATITATATATLSATGLALSTYNWVRIEVNGIENGVATRNLQMAVSSDNGSTYDTAALVGTDTTATAPSFGLVSLYQAGVTGTKFATGFLTGSALGTASISVSFWSTKTSPTNALQFSWNSGNFVAVGNIQIYGVK